GTTIVSSSPATTCAAVTTSDGAATQPLPAMRRPQAEPSTRTTLGAARRTPRECSSAGSGGATGASGPAMLGNGSTRARIFMMLDGGTASYNSCSTSDFC